MKRLEEQLQNDLSECYLVVISVWLCLSMQIFYILFFIVHKTVSHVSDQSFEHYASGPHQWNATCHYTTVTK